MVKSNLRRLWSILIISRKDLIKLRSCRGIALLKQASGYRKDKDLSRPVTARPVTIQRKSQLDRHIWPSPENIKQKTALLTSCLKKSSMEAVGFGAMCLWQRIQKFLLPTQQKW